MDRLYALIGKLPTTKARVAVTLLLYIATGVVTMATGELPGGLPWGGLLVVMSGLDATQYIGKRRSWNAEAATMDRESR